ncbi:PiggyBac transposable element-derived protein 2 [Amphibalanus amphitrite]|uniref:PiggyBac transposable element-derived protein 2 n=1 Tax=Amphibalanus amphitrite TaxID=1232801 RepID=A0A6A4W7C9_AMPAM|nr:PiggyBac transposable element-derived protein 2 [Amphibalanus amphitrite]
MSRDREEGDGKSRRGSYEQRFDRTSEVLLVRWHDNKVVNVMTNYDAADPPTSTTRYDRTAKKRLPIPQPKVLKTYNTGMGGVDLHDQLLGAYEVAIRGKKWYWCLITRMLDMAVVNSHILHKTAATGDQLSLINFRREIATTYLKAAACERDAARPLPSHIPASLRYDGVGHMLAPLNARRRCQLESCKLRSTKRCIKCDVAICFKCFAVYHGLSP